MNCGIINSVTKLHLVGYCYWALHIVARRKHKWRLRTCCAIMSFCSDCLKRHCTNIQPVRAARHHVLIKERNVRNTGIRTWFCDDTRLSDTNVVRSKLSCPEIIRNFWHDFNYILHKRQARCLALLEGPVSTICLGMPLPNCQTAGLGLDVMYRSLRQTRSFWSVFTNTLNP